MEFSEGGGGDQRREDSRKIGMVLLLKSSYQLFTIKVLHLPCERGDNMYIDHSLTKYPNSVLALVPRMNQNTLVTALEQTGPSHT